MRNLVLVVHISLDGFVAGPKGELDGFPSGVENLAFVNELTNTADAAIFGRTTYEMLNGYWPTAKDHPGATSEEIAYSNWYNAVQKIVISRTLTPVNTRNCIIVRDNLADEISNLKMQAGKDILIFGSPSVANELMQHDLIDEYWIFINPVVFGEGIPLFNSNTKKANLSLASTKQFPNGEIALQYINSRT